MVQPLNIAMNSVELIELGNKKRAEHQPEEALKLYAQAFIEDPNQAAAWNNYGNVTRECGFPERAVPFLQHAAVLEPNNVTAQFNLAVTYLLMGDYERGWRQYEHRWNYEHLAGTLPRYEQPRWTGQDLKDKTILVIGEQGHGDNIQFVRFLYNLHVMGAKVLFQTTDGLIPLFAGSPVIQWLGRYTDQPPAFDYWVPIMSIAGIMGITLQNLPKPVNYLNANAVLQKEWLERLGPKKKLRIGFCWSGRKDNWLNEHKGMPFPVIVEMIKKNSQHEWINLQIDATPEESQTLEALGVRLFPGTIRNFADTAALITHTDVVIGVDTAVSHLTGALGKPVWIGLSKFAVDWRWLLNRDDSPWYNSARLFRQPVQDDWASVTAKMSQFLSWFKV